MIGPAEIEGLFGDLLAEISDAGLREQVVRCWVEACREGGWTSVEELRRMPFTLLTETHGIDFVQHTRAVTAGALELGRALVENLPDAPFRVDFDVLVAGGLLHDVGKLLEIEPDGQGGHRRSRLGRHLRHPISGAVLAGRLGVPDAVLNVIACHSKEGEGRHQRVETVLVHQADFASYTPVAMRNSGKLIVE